MGKARKKQLSSRAAFLFSRVSTLARTCLFTKSEKKREYGCLLFRQYDWAEIVSKNNSNKKNTIKLYVVGETPAKMNVAIT